jgi:hemolysin-activating ACP:hemolysin acyltransferase
MLADPERAERAARDLDEAARQAVLSDDGVREVFEWSAGQLLWPLSEMLAGLGGARTAVPMAVIMAALTAGSALALAVLARPRPGHRGQP